MDFEEGIFFLWIGLNEQRLQISVMLVVQKRADGEEPCCVVMRGKGDFPLDSLQLNVDEDGDGVALDLLLLVYHCLLKLSRPFSD